MDETQQRIGDYAVVRKLGEGGMGTVYLATDLKLGRRVALKTLKNAAAGDLDRERFLREARAAAAVEHDNIVPILHVGEAADGSPFLVMPFLQGESLDTRLKREPVAPLELVLTVARDVADGLTAAHARGLVHRDIKPANIWLEADPGGPPRRCKVLDFGLARAVASDDPQLTGSGVVLGTPAYMAPEQARGERVDHRADLFALGTVLYRMATGQPPFPGDTPMAVLWAVVHDAPPPPGRLNRELPRELADLISRLLSKRPEDRPGSAAEVSAVARALLARLAAQVPPPSDSFPQVQPFALELAHSATDLEPTKSAPRRRGEEPSPALHSGQTPRPVPAARRWPWALGAALLLVVPLGLWLSGALGVNRAGDGTVQGEAPKGGEKPATDGAAKGGPKAADKSAPPPVTDPDRAAALWVLSAGGCVNVNDEFQETRSAAALPKGPFRLAMITLNENGRATDDGLKVLAGCPHLTNLALSGTGIGDAGLAHVRGCDKLMYVYLRGTQVTSAGLAHLRDCADLHELDVSYTPVDDAGLVHVKRFSKLTHLNVEKSKVTAAGVMDLARALPECDITWDLGVRRPAADPDRVAALWAVSAGGEVRLGRTLNRIGAAAQLPKERFELSDVYLTSPAADADLGVFAGCKNVRWLSLKGVKVGDAGLAHFAGCAGLERLDLSGARVTDAGLSVLRRWPALEHLDLSDTAAGDDAMACLTGHKQLRVLNLTGTRVRGPGLWQLRGCPSLYDLNLTGTGVTDDDLNQLRPLVKLESLNLTGTRVTNAGAARLNGMLPKCTLTFDGGSVPPKK